MKVKYWLSVVVYYQHQALLHNNFQTHDWLKPKTLTNCIIFMAVDKGK